MVQLSNQSKWKVWMAFVIEAFVLLFMIFGASYMQLTWGIPGLVLTELAFVVIAVAPTLIYKTPLKEVFPVKLLSVKELLGTVIFAIATLMVNWLAIGISLCLVPNFTTELSALNNFIYGDMPFLAIVFVIAVMPAICEEALHRGVILSHLRSIQKDWLIILIMGVFFGLFHLSPLRFLPTAVVGACLSYLMVKKNNILFPMLLHFFNNFITSCIGTAVGTGASTDAAAIANINGLQVLGSYCVIGFLAPVLFVIADSLICPKLHKKHWVVTILLSVVILAAGIVITALTAL